MAIGIGLAATAAVVAAQAAGALERLELMTLDLRFRWTSSIPQSPAIVCIDIDDDTLEVVGRWPWPRDRQAPLISILGELGARAILVDLTWSEGQPLGSVTPENADVLADPLELGAESVEPSFPDYELCSALREAGSVYLAFDYPARDPESSDEFEAAVAALQAGDEAAARRNLDALRARRVFQTGSAASAVDGHLLERARLVAALEREPTLAEQELVQRAGVPSAEVVSRWADRCRVAALERRTRAWLAGAPERGQREAHELFGPLYAAVMGQVPGGDSPVVGALALALRKALGYAATVRNAVVPLERVRRIAPAVDGISPVYYLHARAARRCGFVNFEPDTDGVVRRVPLFVQHGGHALAQVALALACDELGVGADGVEADGRTLTLRTPNGPRPRLRIQLDERGRTLIPWVPEADWVRTFEHLPADALWSLHAQRRALAHNEHQVRAALGAILADERFADLGAQRQTLAALEELERQMRRERYRGRAGDVRALTLLRDELLAELPEIERLARQRWDALHSAAGSASAARDPLTTRRDGAGAGPGAADEVPGLFALIDECRRVEPRPRAESALLAERIGAVVADRICLIGYTAAALPDMKPIPTSRSAAGVMAHANLLSGLLTGRLVRWASPTVNAGLALACGLLVTVLTTYMRPRLAVWLTVLAAVTYVALAGVIAFFRYTYWVGLTPVLGAMLVSFLAIAVFRYVYIDAERRQLANALGQYTTRQIARQVAENPELCRRAETREVSAMFTDLKGFTSLAERIGAQQTQALLNACLGRFTAVMLRHEGMVNKFIGDGVFVFWNPVIYPQPDHALRACETAVDLLAALEELKAEQRRRPRAAGPGPSVFDELVLRIGVATGSAIVGPCGSEQKYDYTCIGDSVNVASRLESANKFYGTQILVNEATRQQVGERFEFRPLGGVRVKGKAQAVPVYELLGRAGQVAPETRDYARAFGAALGLFQQRQWRAALEAFQACQQRRPDDLAAASYVEASASLLSQPPGEDWTGAIELREK